MEVEACRRVDDSLMELEDLFTTGSHLADVPADFRGMPLGQWRGLQIAAQCTKYVAKFTAEDRAQAQLSQKRVWHFRDGYGMKGF